MRIRDVLRRLLQTMRQPRTFYLLGAGTSYGIVPTTQEMRQRIVDAYHDVGVYDVTPAPPSALFDRLIGEVRDETDLREMLLTHMPHAVLDLLSQHALWTPNRTVVPVQYALFDIVAAPATLFTFNLDGLASAYCRRRHEVLEPHGVIDHPWFDDDEIYRELLDGAAWYGVAAPHLTPKVLPAPELPDVILGAAYVRARQVFPRSRALIVAGYSFGDRGGILDDAPSFEFFASVLQAHPRPVYIVSGNPYELAERLRECVRSDAVYPLALRWERFTGFLLARSDPVYGLKADWTSRELDELHGETRFD